MIGLGVALLSVVIGVIVGSLAGFYGGLIDSALMRFTDLFLVIPELAVLLIVAKNPEPSFFGLFDLPPATEVTGMIVILAALGWMAMRAHRARRVPVAPREGVRRSRAAPPGASGPRIIVRHLCRTRSGRSSCSRRSRSAWRSSRRRRSRSSAPGIQLPEVSLGNLISDAESTVGTDLAYLIIFPGLVLFLVVLCVNFVGDGLRDALDPRATR